MAWLKKQSSLGLFLTFAFIGHIQAMNFNETAKRCAPDVHHDTLQALIRVESLFNPYAIGVVKKKGVPYPLKSQPKNLVEAIKTVDYLESQGYNYSMGLGQINKKNFAWLGLNKETVFDPCENLLAASKVLADCFVRSGSEGQLALQKAFSCYYSGNFRFGFGNSDFPDQKPYVDKIINAARYNSDLAKIKIPAVDPNAQIVRPTKQSNAKQSENQNKHHPKHTKKHEREALNPKLLTLTPKP